MINIGLQHFRLVHTIVRDGTLTRAAETLHLTQSALSHQLKELERELGTTVFHRRGKKLLLSDEGERFLRSADKILLELDALEQDLQAFREGRTGRINISTQCYTAYHWLPAILKKFKQFSPGVSVEIMSEATFRPLDYVISGALDIGIVRTRADHPDIYYEPVFEDQLLVVLHRDHPLACREQIEIADFADEELFLAIADPATGGIPVIGPWMQLEGVAPKKVHYIHFTDAIVEMLRSNMGISIMADWIIYPYLAQGDLVARPMSIAIAKRKWYAAAIKHNPPIRNFLHCLKEHFPKMMRQERERILLPEAMAAY